MVRTLVAGLPAGLRKGIRLDGSTTIEEDFRCCHLRLLFALAGDDLGDRDAYDGFELPRQEVKLAIQVMLNAGSAQGAAGAIRRELVRTHGSAAGERTRRLMGQVRERLPRLARYWNTGCGLRLQNIDSNICTSVQRRLREAGSPCLSVHDSFIVVAADADRRGA